MKKLFLVFILLLNITNSFSQVNRIAWIFDPQIGITGNEAKLKEILTDIRQQPGINSIVFTGNLSTKSSEEEFNKLDLLVNELTQTCYFIPGTDDYKWLQGDASIFKNISGDDKFFIKTDNFSVLGLTSAVERRGEGGHFKREDLEWVNSVKDSLQADEPVILILYQPLNSSVDNWFQLINLLSGKNIVAAFSSEGEYNRTFDVSGIPSLSAKGLTAGNKDWSYFIIESVNDSLLLTEVNKSGKQNAAANFPLINPYVIAFKDSVQFLDYSKALMWQYDVKSSLNSSPVVADESIFSVSPGGKIICLNKNGSLKWKTEIEANIIGNLIKDGDLVVVGTVQGDLISINANNGDIFQSIGVGESITSLLTTNTIEVQGGKVRAVIFGTVNGNVYCYNIYSFELIWQNSSAQGMIESKPLVINNRIIFGSWDTYLYCIDKRTGILNWRWNSKSGFYFAPARCSPVSNGKNVYITTPDKIIYAIDLLLGTTTWNKDYGGWESVGISSGNNNLFIKSFKDKLKIISTDDGKLIKEIDLKYGYDTTPLEIYSLNENILLPLKNGTVYSIGGDFSINKILFAGNSRLNTIHHFYENVFVTSNADGKIICFRVN